MGGWRRRCPGADAVPLGLLLSASAFYVARAQVRLRQSATLPSREEPAGPPAGPGAAAVAVVGDEERAVRPAVGFGADPRAGTTLVSDWGDAIEVRRGYSGGLRTAAGAAGGAVVSLSDRVSSLPYTVVAGEVTTASSFTVRGVPQWSLWDLDTFDTVDSGQWFPADRGFCGAPSDRFLGGHCKLATAVAVRNYTQLPPHTRVRVRARVHFIDQWTGEAVSLLAQGGTVWSQSHTWCPQVFTRMCLKYGVDTCGRDSPDRLSVKAEAAFAHSGPTLDLAFKSTLPFGTDPCYKSWGVDDVSVELM